MQSDTQRELVAAVILERPLCLDCIATHTTIPVATVNAALGILRDIRVSVERCATCGLTQTTYRLPRKP